MDCCSISTLLYGQQLISGDMRRTVEHFIEDTHLCSAEGQHGSIHEFVDLDLPQTVTSTISIAVSPDGHTFASTHGDHSVRVFQCLSGVLIRTFTGHPRTPWTVKYHPIDSNVVASGCLGYQVRVWDIRKNCCIAQLRMDYSVISIAFHPRGEYLAMAYGTCVDLWCYQTGVTSASNPSEVRRMIHTRSIRAVLFHPSGRYLLAAAPDVPMRSSDTPSYCRLFVCTYDDFFAITAAKETPPIELTSCPVLVDQIFVYSEGGLDLSPDGSLLLTCALVHQLRRDDDDDAVDHSSSSARHPRMHNVSPNSHSEMINTNERYRGRMPATAATAGASSRDHLTSDPNPAPSAPVSFSTSNIRIARNAARLRAMTASYRNFIESNGPDISALDIGQLGDIMNASANSRPRDANTPSNTRRSYINHPPNPTHRGLNSGTPNSSSGAPYRTDSSTSSSASSIIITTTAAAAAVPPFMRLSSHPDTGATTASTDRPTLAFPALPPSGDQRCDHNVPPFPDYLDRKDDHSGLITSPAPATTGAMEPLSMNLPSSSLSSSILTDMDSSLLGSQHRNQLQLQPAHRPSIPTSNPVEGHRRYQLNYHMNSIEDLSHSRVVSSDTSDLSFNREDSSHTGRWVSEDRLSLFRLRMVPDGGGGGGGGGLEAVLLQTKYLPLALLKAVTSTKLSPSGRYALVGYGVRQAGLVLGHSRPDATCEVLSLIDHMSSVAVFCDEEDEINVALFHPSPGLGIVYGTQKGKLRTRLTSRRCDRL